MLFYIQLVVGLQMKGMEEWYFRYFSLVYLFLKTAAEFFSAGETVTI